MKQVSPQESAPRSHPRLARADIEDMRDNGFCVLRGAIPADVVSECAAQLSDWLRFSVNIDVSDLSSYQHLGSYHRIPFHTGGVFDELLSPAVIGALDALLGQGRYDAPSKHGFFWATLPGCHAGPWVAPRYCGRWHIDHGRSMVREFDVRSGNCAVVPIWLLTDVKPGGGATCGFRGSHRVVSRVLASAGSVNAADFDAFTESYAMNHMDDLVELTGQAGDVVFAHPHFIHAGTGNTGTSVRLICNTGLGLRGHRRLSPAEGPLSVIEQTIAESIEGISLGSRGKWLERLCRMQGSLQEQRGLVARFNHFRIWDDPPKGTRGLAFWAATLGVRACGWAIETVTRR